MPTRMEEFQASGQGSTLARSCSSSLIPYSSKHLPTPSPATSHLTPVLQNSLWGQQREKRSISSKGQKVGVSWKKGAWFRREIQRTPARGVAVAHAEPLQSTPPRAQGHRRACTQHSSARPPSLKARSGQTPRQKATILPTAFLPSRPRVGGGGPSRFQAAPPGLPPPGCTHPSIPP